jgi:hypothetical protein
MCVDTCRMHTYRHRVVDMPSDRIASTQATRLFEPSIIDCKRWCFNHNHNHNHNHCTCNAAPELMMVVVVHNNTALQHVDNITTSHRYNPISTTCLGTFRYSQLTRYQARSMRDSQQPLAPMCISSATQATKPQSSAMHHAHSHKTVHGSRTMLWICRPCR